MDLIKRAKELATYHHGKINQLYGDQPYIVHPAAVYQLLLDYGHTDEAMLASAWLHDVPEDLAKGVVEDKHVVTLDEIGNELGNEVRDILYYVTNVSKKEDGTRKVRKEIDRKHNAKGNWKSQTLKVADINRNISNIRIQNPDFAHVYIPEKILNLKELDKADNKLLKDTLKLAQNELKLLPPRKKSRGFKR